MGLELRFVVDDLSGQPTRALIARHLAGMRTHSPPESVHAFDVDALRRPDVTFWSVWLGDGIVGCGALRRLDAGCGEIKSMRVADAFLGRGIGRAILDHLIAEARSRGMRSLWLETGSTAPFAPALRLYESAGFSRCAPFDRYADDRAPRRRREEAVKADLKHLAAQEMEGGPPEPSLQEEAPNHRMLLRPNGRGGERDGQGAPPVRQVRARKASVVEPLRTCRKRMDDARTGQNRWPGMSLGAPCMLPRRRPALRWREPGSGSCAERGNLRVDVKGDPQAAGTARGRVPTRRAGADRPV